MWEWGQLSVRDVRSLYRVIGDCRDLGSEPGLWQRRACEGLAELLGAPTNGGEGLVGTDGVTTPVAAIQYGFDAPVLELYAEYHRVNATNADPFYRALAGTPGRRVTRARRDLVADDVYLRSPVFEQYLEPGEVHHRLMSIRHSADGSAVSVLHLHRPATEHDFSAREKQVVDFFHAELGRRIGRSLVSATEPRPSALPRRLRQTLACLVQGDSEKEVAKRLGLSPLTTHQYVTTLYRRFGVQSRAQLLAHVLMRGRQAEWARLLNPDAKPGSTDGEA